MTEETSSHPTARMTYISNPLFWVYTSLCIILFGYCAFQIHNPLMMESLPRKTSIVGICMFVALFLQLISQSNKNPQIAKIFTYATYSFEIISSLILSIMILR